LDLALVCSSIFAQKSKSLFTGSLLEISYPFLDPGMVDLALKSCCWTASHEEPKRVLKTALARQVPKEMVYRKKSAFNGDTREYFKNKMFLDRFDRLSSSNSPLYAFLDLQFLKTMRAKLARGWPLPSQTANFIWAAVFVNEWLAQVACSDQSHRLGAPSGDVPQDLAGEAIRPKAV